MGGLGEEGGQENSLETDRGSCEARSTYSHEDGSEGLFAYAASALHGLQEGKRLQHTTCAREASAKKSKCVGYGGAGLLGWVLPGTLSQAISMHRVAVRIVSLS